tara:strand:+ start:2022 stop:2681 length:660 start_codon:yes stop_codon:yes gene_type:complete
MAYRRKGGSALTALAKRRKAKAAKDKEGKLSPMVVKPAMSKLRTGSAPKRKKGGKAMMDLAKRRKPAAKKKPVSNAVNRANRLIAGDNPVRKSKPKAKAAPRRTSKLAPGAGGARGGGTIKATKAPSMLKRAKDYLTKTREGKVLGLMGEAASYAAGGKGALKAGQMLNKKRKLRAAGRAGGQATARKRQAAAGKKTAEGYEQFEKDRKARSRKMGRRN